MGLPPELHGIEGAQQLYNWFGYWPRFHDAEILSLHLNRSGPLSLAVRTWEMTKELDEQGYYILAKHVVIELLMKDVVGLNLSGFSHQNVIFGLNIEKIDEGFRVTLDECYGVSGAIEAGDISIRMTPGKPV
jgi:Immunity protein 50